MGQVLEAAGQVSVLVGDGPPALLSLLLEAAREHRQGCASLVVVETSSVETASGEEPGVWARWLEYHEASSAESVQ